MELYQKRKMIALAVFYKTGPTRSRFIVQIDDQDRNRFLQPPWPMWGAQ